MRGRGIGFALILTEVILFWCVAFYVAYHFITKWW